MFQPHILHLLMNPKIKWMFIILFFIGMSLVVLNRLYVFIEQQYAQKFHQPLLHNPILFKRKLDRGLQSYLETNFSFYKTLEQRQKNRFEHRLVGFMNDKDFVSKDGLHLTEEMKILISATAVMLTFGYRNYKLPNVSAIFIFPSEFKSLSSENLHAGEFSPYYKTVAFSWKEFKKGYDISNDNLNLGIHEFSHALHIRSIMSNDVSSQIFMEALIDLKHFLGNNEAVRINLLESNYIRRYGFENEYEFTAVLMECFFETNSEFKNEFPEIYTYVKRMLGYPSEFKFSDYN